MDQLRIPAGASCLLIGTSVTGNVSIDRGALLVARRVSVVGDVEAHGARRVELSAGSYIGGDLLLAQGGSASVSRTEIDGDLQWTQAGRLTVQQAVISGTLQANQNRGRVIVAATRIGGDLQCRQNVRMPIQHHNAVAGHREGQCAPTIARTPVHVTVTQPPAAPSAHPVRPRPPCAGDSVSDDPSDDSCGDD